MTPRPRTVPDDDILQATARIIGRLGPSRFTLADVGAEVGLSPATLVQRFGTKRALMLALVRSSIDGVEDAFTRLRARHSSPLAALMGAATQMAAMAESPETLANHLAFLQLDLSDPEFHAAAREQHLKQLAGYRALIDESCAAGELRECDADRLARTISAVTGGSLIGWAIERQGKAREYVRADVRAVLEPYLVTAPVDPGH